MSTTINSSLPMRDFLAFIFKNRRKILLAFFIPFMLAIIIALASTPRFKAFSVLTVRLGSEFVYQPETETSQSEQTQTILFDHDQIFKAEVAILESNDLHEKVIKEIGIDTLFPKLKADGDTEEALRILIDDAVTVFNKHFNVNLEKESSVITLSYEHKNAGMAAKVLDALLKLYKEKRKGLFQESREDIERERSGSVRIIQPPSVPAKAKSLRLVIVCAGFVFSFLASVLTAIILNLFSTRFLTPEQIERSIGLPVLATITRRKNPQKQR